MLILYVSLSKNIFTLKTHNDMKKKDLAFHFDFYKTFFFTKINSTEIIYEEDTNEHGTFDFVKKLKGNIPVGEKCLVEIFEIYDAESLYVNDYINFLKDYMDDLIGAQVRSLVWSNINLHGSTDLWVDEDGKNYFPSNKTHYSLFEPSLGCINPILIGSGNYLLCFYHYEEGTEYKKMRRLKERKKSFNHFDEIQDESSGRRNDNDDFFSRNYLGLPGLF